MKRVLAMFLALFMLVGFAGCGAETQTGTTTTGTSSGSTGEDVFNLGCFLILSGTNANIGEELKKGMDVAVKYVNENGGFNGAVVEVEYNDTQSKTEEAVKIVQKMISEGNTDAFITSVNSSDVSATIGFMNDAKIINMATGTSASFMEDESMIYTFRAAANNNRLAPLDVDLILELGFESVAVINGNDDNGKSTANAFIEACEEKGLTVTTQQEADAKDTDFTGQITQIINSNPDTIFLSLIGSQFGPFVKQLRNMGYTGMICSKENFPAQYQEVAGVENSNYIFYVYPYVTYNDIEDCTIPTMRNFLELYQAEYGTLPSHEGAYRGWDSVMALWEASKIAGQNDSESLREAMSQVKIDGLGGTLDFTKGDREGYSEFSEFILIDGKEILLSDWLENGGYEAYKEATGNDK